MMHCVAKLLLTPRCSANEQRRVTLPGKTESTVELNRPITRVLNRVRRLGLGHATRDLGLCAQRTLADLTGRVINQ